MVRFASYLRRVLCKTRLIFPRINGPIDPFRFDPVGFRGWQKAPRGGGVGERHSFIWPIRVCATETWYGFQGLESLTGLT